jgi:triosephosphate isomerase
MKKLIAGNWKMNGKFGQNKALLDAVLARIEGEAAGLRTWPFVCRFRTLCRYRITKIEAATNQAMLPMISLGAQDVSAHDAGAYTGEVAASMLKELTVRYVIVGHSERRQYHGETDQLVADKAKAALAAGVTPIVCIGETLAEREAGHTEEVVKRQLAAVIHTNGHCISEIVVAYEPVWAIGTGKTASPEEAQAVHAVLRAQLKAATDQFAACENPLWRQHERGQCGIAAGPTRH